MAQFDVNGRDLYLNPYSYQQDSDGQGYGNRVQEEDHHNQINRHNIVNRNAIDNRFNQIIDAILLGDSELDSIFDCPKNIVLNELDITEAQFNERRLPYDVNKSYLAVYRYIKQSVHFTQLSIDSQTIGYNIHNLRSLPKVIKECQSLESFFIKDVNLIALGQDFNRLRAVREISVTNVPLNFLPAQTIYLETMILDHTALTENDIAHLLNTQNIVFLYKTDDKSISRSAPNAAVLEQDLDPQGNVIVPAQPQQAPPVNPRARDGCDCLTAGLLLIFGALAGRCVFRKADEARCHGWRGVYL